MNINTGGGGGGGDSHIKQMGILVVSLRDVNFGFWSRLGCSGQTANILCRVLRTNTELCEDKQKSNFVFNLFYLPHCLCDYKLESKISTNSREHYNPINQC